MLFDTHCHLDSSRFADDVDDVLARAKDAGVTRIATIGCAQSLDNVRSALEIAQAHSDWIVSTIGVHPHNASDLDDPLFDAIAEIATEDAVVAVGEMGLDYYYDNSPREVQGEAFRRQIALAREVGKPIIVHTRDAAAETLQILRDENARDVGGIIHCFSEDAPFAKQALDMGFVSSFSGIVTFKSAKGVHDAARQLPLDAILIETDAPYLAPVPMRGKRNEPAFVAHTADRIAALRGMDPMALRAASFENANRVFSID